MACVTALLHPVAASVTNTNRCSILWLRQQDDSYLQAIHAMFEVMYASHTFHMGLVMMTAAVAL